MAVTSNAPNVRPARVGILVSGRGSTMQALVRAAGAPDYPAEIVCVAADHALAPGLEAAAANGIPAIAVTRRAYPTRAAHETALTARLADHGPDLLVLAGYMRVLSDDFLLRWTCLGSHPGKTQDLKGLNIPARVLAARHAATGCTIMRLQPGHGVDASPIIAQAELAVRADDTEQTLALRTLEAEHQIYPKALADFVLATPGTAR